MICQFFRKYLVLDEARALITEQVAEFASREPGVHFGGRLGTYRYLDMHQVIAAAPKEWVRL